MKYEEIFKQQYSEKVRNFLKNQITTINNKNYSIPMDALCELYQDILSETLNNAVKGLTLLTDELCKAKDELTKKIIHDIGKLPEKLTYRDKNYTLNAYNNTLSIPGLVENIYFDILEDVLNERDYYDKHQPRNAEEVFRKDVFRLVQMDLLNYASDFKKYLGTNYNDHIKIKASDNREQLRKISQLINTIKNTNDTLKQQVDKIKEAQIKYNEVFKELNQKEYILTSLLDLKAIESSSAQDENRIEEKIQILNSEIETKKNKLSQEYINCQKSLKTYKTSQEDKAIIIKEFKELDNLFITRLEALDHFGKDSINKIALLQTKEIINMNVNHIRLYEIAKYNIQYANKLLEIYYYILFKHLLRIKSLLKIHTKLNNYKDILRINEEAKRILEILSKEDKLVEEYADISETILKVVIYNVFIKDITPDWSDKFSFWDDYKEYIKTCKENSPIEILEDEPNGFFSFAQFKKREECDSQLEFTTQFNDYKKKFSDYEAKSLAQDIILMGITKLNETDFIEPVAKIFNFNEFRGIGGATFIQLFNSTWVVASTLGMAFKIKKYTNEEIMAYPALHDILLNHETTFLQSYNFFPNYVTGGRELPSDGYEATSTYCYPEVPIAKLDNDKYGNKKSINYQSYFSFWENFYDGDKEIVKTVLYYDKNNNVMDLSEKNLFSAITKLFHNTLEQYADYSKINMDKSGWLHIIARVLIPFYDVLYKKLTDDAYELTKADIISLVIDGIVVIVTLGAAGNRILETTMTSILSSISKAKKIGITGRKNLLIYAARNATELPENIAKILAKAAFDLVNPIPFFSLPTRFPKITKLFRKKFGTANVNIGESYGYLHRAGELSPEWSIKNRIIDLPENKKRHDGYYNNVYELSPESPYSLADKDYYIKAGYEVYQVEWDDYSRTWRVIDQRNTVTHGYKIPVKWDNIAKRWVTHSSVPGLGGAPIVTKNLVEISEEKVRPLVDLLEDARKEALNRVETVLNVILNPKEDQKKDIIIAFHIFLGLWNKTIFDQFKIFLKKQEEVLKVLSPEEDIVYYGGFDDVSARSVFTTNVNSYYDQKQLNKPFLHAYVNAIVDVNNELKFTRDQFKDYLSTVLMHEIHHATKSATNDLAYEAMLQQNDGRVKIDISGIVELTVPHLRMIETSRIIDDEFLLTNYSYLDKKIENIIRAKDNPGADIQKINKQLSTRVHEMIEKSNRTVFTNPDNVAFLINLIYDSIINKSKFDSFLKDYDNWFNYPSTPLIWEYGSNVGMEDFSLHLENSDIGKVNRGFLDPITNPLNTFYVNDAYPIETTFTYTISDITRSNIVSTEIDTTNFLDTDILTTCKGNDIKTQNIIDEVKSFESNTDFFSNINFINISNNKNRAIGIKVKKSDIIYGYPILVYNQYKGIFTLVCANKGDHFYVFYCNRSLIESISHILKVSNEIYSGDIQKFKALNTSSIDNFLIHLGNRYDRIVIHYSDVDLNTADKARLSHIALPNTSLHQYDKVVDTYNNYVAVGQSYILLTKTMIGKPKATSNSYVTLIRKEEKKLVLNNMNDYSYSYEF